MKKIYFLIVAMLLAITAHAALPGETFVINGIGNSWKVWTKDALADYTFTETSSGVYEFDLPGQTLSGKFLIVALNADGTNGDWNKKIGSNGTGIKVDVPYKYTIGGADTSLANGVNIDNPHFTLDTNAGTLLIHGVEKENSFDVVYMVGDFGSGWDASITDYPLQPVAGKTNVYEGTYTFASAAAGAATLYTVPRCGGNVLQLTGEDVMPAMGRPYTVGTGDKAFSLMPGTYTIQVTADQKAESAVVIFTSSDPVVTDYTIYWDNSQAQWDEVYAYVTDKNGEAFEPTPGLELYEVSDNIWSIVFPSDYTTVVFNNGDEVQAGPYTVKDSYIYSTTNSGSFYEPPVDYSGWYVNVLGDFNSWSDNGKNPDADGICVHKNLPIGTGGFKIKIWNGEDKYLSNGQAVSINTPYALTYDDFNNMTIAGAAAGDEFDVTFNCKTSEMTITRSGDIDYTGWYFNIVGDFNEWSTEHGTTFDAEGIATNEYENVNTAFKVRVYDGELDHDYALSGTLTADTWNNVNGNQTDMMLPAQLQEGYVSFKFNNKTKSLYIARGEGSVDSILADQDATPVFYNLQGLRVDNPTDGGIYIVVRGAKASKELVR